MIDNFTDIEAVFKELDTHIDSSIQMYMIGGGVLLKRGMKAATKDIDIIKNRCSGLTHCLKAGV